MKRFLVLWAVIAVVFPFFGESLRSARTILVEDGRIEQNNVIADADGQLFLEFEEGTYVVDPESRLSLKNSEILPPQRTDEPKPNKRPFTLPVTVFEVTTANFRPYIFTNKATQRNKGAKLLMIPPEKYGRLQLWKWQERTEDQRDHWVRVGGGMTKPEGQEKPIFVAFLYGTGIYGIYDENPTPDGSGLTPEEEVIYAPESPFPTILPPEEELEVLLARVDEIRKRIEAEKPEEPKNLPIPSESGDEVPFSGTIERETTPLPSVSAPVVGRSNVAIDNEPESDEIPPFEPEVPQIDEILPVDFLVPPTFESKPSQPLPNLEEPTADNAFEEEVPELNPDDANNTTKSVALSGSDLQAQSFGYTPPNLKDTGKKSVEISVLQQVLGFIVVFLLIFFVFMVLRGRKQK